MFERFTDRARRVVVLAQEEARLLNHGHIGTEHLFLGLVREGKGVAAESLESIGLSLAEVRQRVVDAVGRSEARVPMGSHITFTPQAKMVLELSLREALQLGHNYIGTEHILLGLLREKDGVVAEVLTSLGADLPRVRAEVIQLLAARAGAELVERAAQASAGEAAEGPAIVPACPKCGSALATSGSWQEMDLPGTEEGARSRWFLVASCRNCGTILGIHPGTVAEPGE